MRVCGQCQKFIPSKWNPKSGAGMCLGIANAIAKCKKEGRSMDKTALASAYAERGGKIDTPSAICWPTSNRDKCQRFESIQPVNSGN